MYKKSIKENSKYLVPFIEGIKYYGIDNIEHTSGTMIILNKNGDILTCKHIAERFIINKNLGDNYPLLLNKLSSAKNKEEKEKIEKELKLNNNSVVLTNINLPFKIKSGTNIEVILHNYLDLAIIRFSNLKTNIDNYPVFSKKLIEQGQSVCKLSFDIPEYDLFEYNKKINNIVIKDNRRLNFPLFPMDGIATRIIIDEKNNPSMFETSTPGIRGQSGGAIFSPEGIVYGIQSMTSHLDLNFDIDEYVTRGINKKRVTYNPFMNLGIGVASTEIIKFLDDNKIEYKSV